MPLKPKRLASSTSRLALGCFSSPVKDKLHHIWKESVNQATYSLHIQIRLAAQLDEKENEYLKTIG